MARPLAGLESVKLPKICFTSGGGIVHYPLTALRFLLDAVAPSRSRFVAKPSSISEILLAMGHFIRNRRYCLRRSHRFPCLTVTSQAECSPPGSPPRAACAVQSHAWWTRQSLVPRAHNVIVC